MAPELGPLPRYRRPAHYARHVPLGAATGAVTGAVTGSSPPVAHLTGFAQPWRFRDVSLMHHICTAYAQHVHVLCI
tara:strand:+ start:802 stop:1029 length:228 start_codon:yes stop_codon:yes gene_type:complete